MTHGSLPLDINRILRSAVDYCYSSRLGNHARLIRHSQALDRSDPTLRSLGTCSRACMSAHSSTEEHGVQGILFQFQIEPAWT